MSGDVSVSYGTCPVCGLRMLPVLELSPCGHDAESEIDPLDSEGVVYSWTRLYGDGGARLMVMADFLDGSLRVTAPFASDSVEIGDIVELRQGTTTPYELHPMG